MGYQVKIDTFEGPIDLLLHLLEKNEVEIYDVKISKITQQYLDYIATMQKLDLNVASEFLIMAAKLMEIKAQNLLPKDNNSQEEEEIDPRKQLVERLLEYKKYKQLTSRLRDFESEQRKSYSRNVAPLLADLEFEESNPLENITLNEFAVAFKEVLKRKKKKQDKSLESKKESQTLSHLEPEKVTIQEQQGYIVQQLIVCGNKIDFSHLFSDLNTKLELVVTFMALLELIKLGEIKIKQRDNFAEIKIYRIEGSDTYAQSV